MRKSESGKVKGKDEVREVEVAGGCAAERG